MKSDREGNNPKPISPDNIYELVLSSAASVLMAVGMFSLIENMQARGEVFSVGLGVLFGEFSRLAARNFNANQDVVGAAILSGAVFGVGEWGRSQGVDITPMTRSLAVGILGA